MNQVLKTLIVDDSISQCQVLREHLLHFGVSLVDYCHDGEEALARLAESERQCDAIFIDLHMHGMDGLELMHRLHELHYAGAVVIISALDARIVEYTMEVVSTYNLRLIGSIAKPIERSLVAFMVRRIRGAKYPFPPAEELPKKREVISALEANNLLVYFQPVINSNTNGVKALECLSRLPIEGRSLCGPAQFLPVIEKFDLFDLFTERLFKKAAPAYRRIKKRTGIEGKLNLNFSPTQLFDNDLPNILEQQIEHYGLNKDSVCLEITENYSLADEQQQKNLSRLRIHGFQLALDDFGAGYTNVRQVKNLPFNMIKLDTELINGMHKDPVLKIIIESVYKITQQLKLDLVAEGVANPHDLITLDDIGIHLHQGFFFSRPKPEEELVHWHREWERSLSESQAFDKQIFDYKKR